MSLELAHNALHEGKITYEEHKQCIMGKLVVTETYLWELRRSQAFPSKKIKYAVRKLETPEERELRRANEAIDHDINKILGLRPPWRQQFGPEI